MNHLTCRETYTSTFLEATELTRDQHHHAWALFSTRYNTKMHELQSSVVLNSILFLVKMSNLDQLIYRAIYRMINSQCNSKMNPFLQYLLCQLTNLEYTICKNKNTIFKIKQASGKLWFIIDIVSKILKFLKLAFTRTKRKKSMLFPSSRNIEYHLQLLTLYIIFWRVNSMCQVGLTGREGKSFTWSK